MASISLLSVRELTAQARQRGAMPRVHPNGFVQLDLSAPADEDWGASKLKGHSGADVRLHIWNPPGMVLPHQKTTNEIHDHVFDMSSTVVRGTLIQKLYEFVVGTDSIPTHELYRAVYEKKSASRLAPLGVIGRINLVDAFATFNDTYTQPAFTLHDSVATTTVVTVMQKVNVHDNGRMPTVVCKINEPPDNTFDRATAAPQDLLWCAIEESIGDL